MLGGGAAAEQGFGGLVFFWLGTKDRAETCIDLPYNSLRLTLLYIYTHIYIYAFWVPSAMPSGPSSFRHGHACARGPEPLEGCWRVGPVQTRALKTP